MNLEILRRSLYFFEMEHSVLTRKIEELSFLIKEIESLEFRNKKLRKELGFHLDFHKTYFDRKLYDAEPLLPHLEEPARGHWIYTSEGVKTDDET